MKINVHDAGSVLKSKVEGQQKKVKKGATATYLTSQEKREMQESFGDPAYILFDFLMDMTKHRNPDVSTRGLQDVTGWSVHKVRRTRTILIDAGLMYQVKFYSRGSSKLTVTYLGAELVIQAKREEEAAKKQCKTED